MKSTSSASSSLLALAGIAALAGVPLGQYAALGTAVAFMVGAMCAMVSAHETAHRAFSVFVGLLLAAMCWPIVAGIVMHLIGNTTLKFVAFLTVAVLAVVAAVIGYVEFDHGRHKLEAWSREKAKASVKRRTESDR